jgi:aminopeptidase N
MLRRAVPSGRLRAALGFIALAPLLAACASGPPPDMRPGPASAGLPEPAAVPAGRVPPPGPYLPGFRALHYAVALDLPATGEHIAGRATVTVLVERPAGTLRLDLSGLRATAARVARGGAGTFADTELRQDDGRVFVTLPAVAAGDTLHIDLVYDGTPDDGLILRENVHGRRTAFADNWPDRARFWFPSIDHPSHKATVEFLVAAPPEWLVIANGRLLAAPEDRDDGRWHWRTDIPIPTYLMVIGGAPFAVHTVEACAAGGRTAARPDGCVEVTAWTFPEDSASGARIFRRAGDMVEYYSRTFGAFPYEKLAHVQSATRFGGMENASAIFYSEHAIAAGTLSEVTVAHEIAHQWFGNAVTPAEWNHLWLSEGFATYFGMQYFEHADGPARFRELLDDSRRGYLESDVTDLAMVDTLRVPGDNLFRLLNRNSYNKGGQILHMLRGMLGDAAFFDGVRRYYARHEHGNARTADLQRAFEEVSGRELDEFFAQWAYAPGHPRLRVAWSWDAGARQVVVTLDQVQPEAWPTFRMPIELEFLTPQGPTRARGELAERQTVLRLPLPSPPSAVTVDPDGWLLKETVED